jgi:tetratricopeptide (TPR) repeat protein
MLKPPGPHIYNMAFLKSAKTLMMEGAKYLQEKQYEKALKRFQQAKKKKPNDPNLLNYIAQTYAALEDLEKAVEIIEKAIELQPEVPIHKQLYATFLMRQGKTEEAIPIIDETLELQPVDVIYILRGQADYNLGKMESAIEFFDKALELDPNNPLSNHMKGLVLYRLERYAEAIPYLELALSIGEIESLLGILEECKARASS